MVEKGRATWQVRWTAPDRLTEPLQLHVAANAANGDKSEFGDMIFTGQYQFNSGAQ